MSQGEGSPPNQSDPSSQSPTSPTGSGASSGSSAESAARERVQRALTEAERGLPRSRGVGGAPTIAERIEKAKAILQKYTGKDVILRDPGAPPEAVKFDDLGREIYTADELQEVKIDAESDIAQLTTEAADLLAERYDDATLKVGARASKTLGRFWNRVLIWAFGTKWLRNAPLVIAGLVTLVVAVPRFLKVLRYELKRRKEKQSAQTPA